MSRLQTGLAGAVGLLGLLGLVLPRSAETGVLDTPFLTTFAVLAALSLVRFHRPLPVFVDGCLTLAAGILSLIHI